LFTNQALTCRRTANDNSIPDRRGRHVQMARRNAAAGIQDELIRRLDYRQRLGWGSFDDVTGK